MTLGSLAQSLLHQSTESNCFQLQRLPFFDELVHLNQMFGPRFFLAIPDLALEPVKFLTLILFEMMHNLKAAVLAQGIVSSFPKLLL